MSYNVLYNSLPTFQTKSIGYSDNKTGNLRNVIPETTVRVINVCNFNLDVGIYIITCNISYLGSSAEDITWWGGISSSATTIETYISATTTHSPNAWWSDYFYSNINFTHVIKKTVNSVLYVNIEPLYPTYMPQSLNEPFYNVSIVRIA